MPIEIRELVIKTTIGSRKQASFNPEGGENLNGKNFSHLKKKIKKEVLEELKDWIKQSQDR
ncbi:MAG: DUF5908 family protein [Bacteroidia bacterium]|nr:DUF5908 family protein [Bacteroidia bacterium]